VRRNPKGNDIAVDEDGGCDNVVAVGKLASMVKTPIIQMVTTRIQYEFG
jgi:hypothetical protein